VIVVLAFSPVDVDQALTLLEFIGQLGGCQEYKALLVADAAVQWSKCVDMLSLANQIFHSASLVTTDSPVTGWPQGANALWLAAAKHCQAAGVDFLWMEADAIPLKRGWLVSIDKMRQGSRYFGYLYMYREQVMQVMSGIAVYPADAFTLLEPIISANPTKAWDVSCAEAITPLATHTKLIQHFYGEMDLAPTFIEQRNSETRRNAFELQDIWPEAVIFHRNKDGTLLQLLRKQLNLSAAGNFVVVLPFCNLDVLQLLKNLDWMKRLGTPKTHDCLLSYDRSTNSQVVQQVLSKAREVFCNVQTTSYHVPHGTRFPQTAAWQHAARTMQKLYRHWLWMEADAIPLKRQWLEVLQNIYDNCRQPFAGPMVQGASHCNGTPTIYPANTPELLPRTMSHTENAWDMEAAEEMRGNVKDIGHIAYCAWGIKDGRLNPLEGEAPSFPPGSNHLMNQIPKTAVVFHRDKSGSLIDRLTA
jgi:hypothetical protein